MDNRILIGAAALLLVSLGFALTAWLRERRRARTLAEHIEQYLQDGTALPFSVRDQAFSRLHNDVCDLMHALDTARENRRKEAAENADFVADVSHQLKTPLAGLRLYCELTNETNARDNAQKQLQLIERMETLVQSLLRLEKIRAGAYDMQFTTQSLQGIVLSCAAELRPMFPKKKIVCTGDAVLSCDKPWLIEAFGNLLKNACEHTDPGGTVSIRMETTERSVLVTVQDNGGGVPEAQLPQLFHRFYTAQNATPGSTGIGLAICRAIIEKHHGTVSAENADGGLKVTVCFPVLEGSLLTKL